MSERLTFAHSLKKCARLDKSLLAKFNLSRLSSELANWEQRLKPQTLFPLRTESRGQLLPNLRHIPLCVCDPVALI